MSYKINGKKVFILVASIFCILIIMMNVPFVGSGWDSIEFNHKKLPDVVDEDDYESTETYVDVNGIQVYVREVKPKSHSNNKQILFLHGAAFKSQTWVDLGTLSLMARLGIHSFAVDLPGYGNTRGKLASLEERLKFIKALLSVLHLNRPIVVSPSMSGSFSIPLLVHNAEQLGGFVAVAPVQTEYYSKQDSKADVPTLVIYGSKDTGLGLTSVKNLNMKTRKVYELPNASHPAYLDQPEMFHMLLYNFARYLSHTSDVVGKE